MTDDLKQLTRDDFQPHIGDHFLITLQNEDGSTEDYPLELYEIEGIGIKKRDMEHFGRESFALRFRNPDTTRYLKQQVYPIQHDAFDNLALFLVPLGPENNQMLYEVIFT